MSQPIVKNLEAFVSHCERTLDSLEKGRILRKDMHNNDKKMVGFMLRWLVDRCGLYKHNTIPAEFSQRLAAVMQRLIDFRAYNNSQGHPRGLGNVQKQTARNMHAYLTALVPTGTIEERFLTTSDYMHEDTRYILRRPTNPTWGDYGILRGFATTIKTGSSKHHTIINPNYEYLQRDAKVFGHNLIDIGAWYPRQLMALFAGAHDEKMKGIAGTAAEGAWSIVVSGHYDEFDQDNGDTLFYSSQGSRENTDPNQAKRNEATSAMLKSIETGTPVRVLRSGSSGGGVGKWKPKSGLRYDGLYTVVEYQQLHNKMGGLFLSFKLIREPNQTPLTELMRIPDEEEVQKYNVALAGH